MNIHTDMALCLSSRGVRKVVLWDLDLEGLNELKQNIEAMNRGVEVSVRQWTCRARRGRESGEECTG